MLALLLWRWADPIGAHAPTWVPAVLAQAPIPPVNPSVLESYGPGGIIAAIALALMWAERQRANKAEDENRDLNKQISQQLVPAVVTFTGEATRLTQAVTEAIRVMEQARRDH